MQKLEVMLPT